MIKKLLSFIFLLLISDLSYPQIPSSWTLTGIGGGGALYAPSINPANPDEYYVACDMGEEFHTADFGLNYSQFSFYQFRAGPASRMVMTNDPNILYCIDYSNNQTVPVRSDDGGITWHHLSGNPDPSEQTYGLWADYHQPDHLLLAYYGSTWFSNDGGISFQQVHATWYNGAGTLIGGVFFDGQNIFIGTNEGLLVSTNGGATFSADASTGIPPIEKIYSFAAAKQGGVTKFYVLTSDSNNVYAGITGSDYSGMLLNVYSMDYGSGHWTSCLNGIVPSGDYLMFVAMAENDTSIVYAAGSSPQHVPNMLKTTDGGASWQHVFLTTNNQNINTAWCGDGGDHGWSFPECPFGIAVSPADPSRVIFSDYSCVHKTSDGGATWHQAYVQPADEHPAGAASPVYQSYHSVGLENTSCWDLHWSSANDLFACFTDIRGIRSTDGGQSWSFNYSGHTQNTMYRIESSLTGDTIFGATSTIHDLYQSTRLQDAQLDASGALGKVLYSTDKGATWQLLNDLHHPVFWVARDPHAPNRLYAAVVNHTANAGGIWVSNNINLGASSTWAQLPAPARTEGHPHSVIVLNDGTVLCTYSGRRNPAGAFTASSGVFIYDPSTGNWTDRSAAGMLYWTMDPVIDPTDALQNTWYVCVFSGWGGAPNGLGGLYKTTDRGLNWTRINNLDRVNSITFNPVNTDQVFLTTEEEGLWTSLNVHAATPVFQQVASYPFQHPERVYFNPYDADKVWVTSTGNALRYGSMSPTGISPGFTSVVESLELFPNPAGDFINWKIPGNQDKILEIRLFDETGRRVNTEIRDHQVLLEHLPAGMYTLQCVTGKQVFVKKFIHQ